MASGHNTRKPIRISKYTTDWKRAAITGAHVKNNNNLLPLLWLLLRPRGAGLSMRTASVLRGRGGHHGKNVAATPRTPRRDLFPPPRLNCATKAAHDYARCGVKVRDDHLTGLGEVWAVVGRGKPFLHMGEACGKWSEVAACVQTNEAGLRIRWFTVMDTAAASPFTKVTLAAVSV